MPYVVTSAPGVEPLSLAEAKNFVRTAASDAATEATLTAMVTAARVHVESLLWRQLITATYELRLECFPVASSDRPYAEILAPRPPLQSVSSVVYVDADGESQTWDAANYVVDVQSEPGRIYPAYGVVWPTVRKSPNAVIVTYDAGFGDAATDVPEVILLALRLVVADMWACRLPVARGNSTVERLLDPESVRDLRLVPEGAA